MVDLSQLSELMAALFGIRESIGPTIQLFRTDASLFEVRNRGVEAGAKNLLPSGLRKVSPIRNNRRDNLLEKELF